MTLNFVRHAWIKRTVPPQSVTIPLEVTSLTKAHLEWWNVYIDPVIKSPDCSWRADHDWEWETITWDCFGIRKRSVPYYPESYALTLPQHCDRDGFPLVVGLMKIDRRSVYPLNHEETAVFLWYCSTAPRQALVPFLGTSQHPDVGVLTIDTAAICAYQDMNEGRVWLHADPADPNLSLFYKNQGMMQLLPNGVRLPGIRRFIRRNDGRYFVLTPGDALILTNSLTPLR